MSELLYGVRDGDLVEIVSCKDRRIDPSVARFPRETPIGLTVHLGRRVPLLLIPVGVPSRLPVGALMQKMEPSSLLPPARVTRVVRLPADGYNPLAQ